MDQTKQKTAKIYSFPARGVYAKPTTAAAAEARRGSFVAHKTVMGGAWYHDAAVADAAPKRSQ